MVPRGGNHSRKDLTRLTHDGVRDLNFDTHGCPPYWLQSQLHSFNVVL